MLRGQSLVFLALFLSLPPPCEAFLSLPPRSCVMGIRAQPHAPRSIPLISRELLFRSSTEEGTDGRGQKSESIGDCSVWKVTGIKFGRLSVRCQHPGWYDSQNSEILFGRTSWKDRELNLLTQCPLQLARDGVDRAEDGKILLCWIDAEHSREFFQREVLRVCLFFDLQYRPYGSVSGELLPWGCYEVTADDFSRSTSTADSGVVVGFSAGADLPDAIVCDAVEGLPGTLNGSSVRPANRPIFSSLFL